MATTCSHHRRPVVPPMRTPDDALAALALATDSGRARCAVLACVDSDRRPLAMFIVDGGPGVADDLVVALDVLLDASGGTLLNGLVLALSRPGRDAEPVPDDLDAWPNLERRCVEADVTLLDWFIVADGLAVSVAERLGRPSAW